MAADVTANAMVRLPSAVFRGKAAAALATRSSAGPLHALNQRLWFRDHRDWKVLDVGSGTGELGKMGRDEVAVWIDLDLSLDILQVDPPGCRRRVLADGAALPFKSGSFDAAIVKFALHHIRDAEGLFAELARVLRRGGLCVVVDPFFGGGAIDRVRLAILIAGAVLSHGAAEFFCTYRTLEAVRQMIRDNGFAIEEESSLTSPAGHAWLPNVLLKLRRIDD